MTSDRNLRRRCRHKRVNIRFPLPLRALVGCSSHKRSTFCFSGLDGCSLQLRSRLSGIPISEPDQSVALIPVVLIEAEDSAHGQREIPRDSGVRSGDSPYLREQSCIWLSEPAITHCGVDYIHLESEEQFVYPFAVCKAGS